MPAKPGTTAPPRQAGVRSANRRVKANREKPAEADRSKRVRAHSMDETARADGVGRMTPVRRDHRDSALADTLSSSRAGSERKGS